MNKIIKAGILSTLLFPVAFALESGDAVSLSGIASEQFIKGEAPKGWEEGKVYIVECWATWCPPCIKAVPHMDELYDKYHDKGLEVVGVSVNDDKNAVNAFVKKKGDDMSYSVAYAAKDGDFMKDWYSAAGVRGIPHTFVVKDGKLLMQMHPMDLTEKLVQKLLDPKADIEAILNKEKEEEVHLDSLNTQTERFFSARISKNKEELVAALAKVKELDIDRYDNLYSLYLLDEKDWEGLKTLIQAKKSNLTPLVMSIFTGTDEEEGVDSDLLLMMEPHLKIGIAGLEEIMKSRLHSRLGNKEKAVSYAEKALKIVKTSKGAQLPVEPFNTFIKRLEEDKPLTLMMMQTELQKAVGR